MTTDDFTDIHGDDPRPLPGLDATPHRDENVPAPKFGPPPHVFIPDTPYTRMREAQRLEGLTEVPRELLAAVLDTVKVVAAGPLDDAGFCIYCYRPMFWPSGEARPDNHRARCPVRLGRKQREALDALLRPADAAHDADDADAP